MLRPVVLCLVVSAVAAPAKAEVPTATPSETAAPARKKLSYKLQRELEAIPGQIDALEAELAELQGQIADPAFYQKPPAETGAVLGRMESLQRDLDALLERWAELEE